MIIDIIILFVFCLILLSYREYNNIKLEGNMVLVMCYKEAFNFSSVYNIKSYYLFIYQFSFLYFFIPCYQLHDSNLWHSHWQDWVKRVVFHGVESGRDTCGLSAPYHILSDICIVTWTGEEFNRIITREHIVTSAYICENPIILLSQWTQ